MGRVSRIYQFTMLNAVAECFSKLCVCVCVGTVFKTIGAPKECCLSR